MTTCRRHDDCPERTCRICRREHVTHNGHGTDHTCATCLHETRQNLAELGNLVAYFFGEALIAGINSQAAMLAGPAADPEIWERRAILIARAAAYADAKTAAAAALDALLEDNRDEPHPGWVLRVWHGRAREHLGHEDTRLTLTAARDYLAVHLTRLAHDPDFAFEEMAGAFKRCRAYCEEAIGNGDQTERGITCPGCERKRLVKVYDDQLDHWQCPGCGNALDEEQHAERLHQAHVATAKHLPLSDLATRTGIPFTTLRNWSKPTRHVTHADGVYTTPPKLKPVGKIDGTRIYAVEHAEELRDAR